MTALGALIGPLLGTFLFWVGGFEIIFMIYALILVVYTIIIIIKVPRDEEPDS